MHSVHWAGEMGNGSDVWDTATEGWGTNVTRNPSKALSQRARRRAAEGAEKRKIEILRLVA